jgi:hypothetical protein
MNRHARLTESVASDPEATLGIRQAPWRGCAVLLLPNDSSGPTAGYIGNTAHVGNQLNGACDPEGDLGKLSWT